MSNWHSPFSRAKTDVMSFDEDQIDRVGPTAEVHEVKRSLGTVLVSDLNQVGVEAAAAAVLYGAKKLADTLRKRPPPSPEPEVNQGDDG